MEVLEDKNCPRCNRLFKCKADTLEICQCSAIYLNNDERKYIQKLYNDCLCIDCLRELKAEFQKLKSKKKTGNLS